MKDTTVFYYPPQKIVNLGNWLIFDDFFYYHILSMDCILHSAMMSVLVRPPMHRHSTLLTRTTALMDGLVCIAVVETLAVVWVRKQTSSGGGKCHWQSRNEN